ncbi:hypothetical protein DDE18_00975 [Nocardioides gansuensis]|uniref:ABC3 transporter permease C-terminal domain-containing protein n=1 Tax=Nocardioides gansuensis TaxID=2138300 RepID=A0A2T8FEU2_9ACTN|nr:ABC transporter permease [Nocardioides gansuensis]PVG84242.1 hypothetical protein DDE18_00975 [Nocardioides gansuensis]
MSRLAGWRPALRIAWREALRAKGRSLLVLAMIALPVLAVTAAVVVIKTSEVRGLEAADRDLGAADARIWTEGGGRVVQAADPLRESMWYLDGPDREHPLTEEDVREVLGHDTRLLPLGHGYTQVLVGERSVDVEATEVDLSDAMAEGLFELTSGRLPEGGHEVVVNDALLAKGVAVGDTLDLVGVQAAPVVVGAGRDATYRDIPVAIGPAGSLLAEGSSHLLGSWLVETGPVLWSDVLALNELGGAVQSRAVLADPPPVREMAEEMGYDTGMDEVYAVIALIVTMALLEVVLLAGPAFAVGARRQSRTIALLAANGGTPVQGRRVVLASGVVLGALAAALGVGLGIVTGWAVLPAVQRFNSAWLGPFEVPWTWLAGIAAFGVASAFLAAVVPAWIASRQDVVAVLAGRRGDRKPSAKSPVLGVVLVGIGIASSAYGAVNSDSGNGAYWIAGSAIISVLGMILIVPLVVSLVARLSGRFPLVLRYAARDAARHRTRTVPAVAAVAATVAGVVALGIANASDEAENASTYTPQLPMGMGSVTWYPGDTMTGEAPDRAEVAATWAELRDIARATLPEVEMHEVRGLQNNGAGGTYTNRMFRVPGDETEHFLLQGYGGSWSASELVSDGDLSGIPGLEPGALAQAEEALADGRVVVFSNASVEAERVEITAETWGPDSDQAELDELGAFPAAYVVVSGMPPAQAVLPTDVAEQVGEVATVGLLLDGDSISKDQEEALDEAVGGLQQYASVYVERGYQRPAEATIILLVLGCLGGVLMLGGTLTATFLALSDARPDLATLSAVGAAPRTRRGVAASYAVVVGFVGALLGAAVGFIPGVAISRPLTSMNQGFVQGVQQGSGPYLDIPWLLILTLVVALPLLTAAIVGLTARSRLPLVARLD